MDKFKEFMESNKTKLEPNVEGCFECQTCEVLVTEAYYDGPNSLLIWKCPDSHTSHIKDIRL